LKDLNNVWSVIAILATGFLAILLPMNMLFGMEWLAGGTFWYWLISVILLLDIFISFNQSHVATNEFLLPNEGSAKYYLKNWLAVDLLGALPLGLITGFPAIGLVRLVKLIRVYYLMKVFARKQIVFSIHYYWLFVVYWYILMVHGLTIGWLLVSGIKSEASVASVYLEALYWVTSIVTTIGGGGYIPQSNEEYVYTIFVQLSGVILFAYILATVFYYYRRKDPTTTSYLDNINKVRALSRFRGLPKNIQAELMDYFTYQWRNRLGFNEADSLMGIPDRLKSDVALHLKKDMLEKVDIFKKADENLLKNIAGNVEPGTLNPGDILFESGDTGQSMYFVVTGVLVATDQRREKVFGTFHVGEFFGEIIH
jgi:voltage-gated potassium channel